MGAFFEFTLELNKKLPKTLIGEVSYALKKYILKGGGVRIFRGGGGQNFARGEGPNFFLRGEVSPSDPPLCTPMPIRVLQFL